MLVDCFPAMIVLVPEDHPIPASQLNPAINNPGALSILTARIVVTDNEVIIARDQSEGPVVVFQDRVVPGSISGGNTAGYLSTQNGNKIAWLKDTACGCGSRLRSWRPYKFLTSVADPQE